MLRKSGIIFVMLIAVAILVTASASAVSANAKKPVKNDWVITQATPDSLSSDTISGTFTTAASNVYYIVQGQTYYYSFYVPSGTTGVTIDLNWGNTANSLQYTMYAADGSVAGPCYDNADGRIDGRICIHLSQNGAIIPSGTYYSRVYGYSVTGAEDYTI